MEHAQSGVGVGVVVVVGGCEVGNTHIHTPTGELHRK